MKDTGKTNQEGGTDFEGLQDFLIDVDTTGFDEKPNEVEMDLGEQKTDDKSDDQDDTPKGDEAGNSDDSKNTDNSDDKKDTVKETEDNKDNAEAPEADQSDSYYGKLAQKFLNKGKWQDAEIEKGDGTVVKLSELDKIDEETFFAIEESQSKFNEDEIKNNYIKKGDFDENKLKVIEILKEGGDIKDIFSTPEEAVRPFEGVDIEDSTVQKNVFFNYLTKVQQLNPEDAKVVLANHDKRGELEPKVKEIVEGYQKQYDDNLSAKLATIKAEKAERITKDKEFSKNLQEIYKNYSLDEKLAKKFSTLGTKRTDDGDFELDSIYAEKMEKPEEAADLIFFLTDKEGYLKSKMAETKIKTETSHLKKINLVKDKQRKDDKASSTPQDGRSDFIISVNE